MGSTEFCLYSFSLETLPLHSLFCYYHPAFVDYCFYNWWGNGDALLLASNNKITFVYCPCCTLYRFWHILMTCFNIIQNNFTVWNISRVTHQFSSVQFSRSVVFDSLRPYESQHARPPCPSPTPGVYSNLCPSSQWCHPAISSSIIPFFSCPRSLPALVSNKT